MPTVFSPFNYIADPTADRSLFGGEIYFGRPQLDPLVPGNRVNVRQVNADGTFTVLAQPLSMGAGGVIEANGSPVQLDIVEDVYSILIRDRNGVQRYSFPRSGPGVTGGRQGLIDAGGLPFDDTVSTTGPAFLIVEDDHTNAVILVDASAAAVTINLPAAALTGDKFRFAVKKIDSSANTVTIDADGGDLIDGAATYVISEQWEAAGIQTDGTRWNMIEVFVFNLSSRLDAVETRSTTNETNITTNTGNITDLLGSPRVFAAARTDSTGTIGWSVNLTVNRPQTGRYDYTFTNAIPTGSADNYTVHVTPESQRVFSVSNLSASGFRLSFNLIAQPADNNPSDVNHHVTVIAEPAAFT